MSDLDAMAYNGRNHHGKIDADTAEDEEVSKTPGDQKLWDEIDTL